ncbi:MAG: substrate-binding domain-containing protein, partial [Paracoccaceae bacterium]|nr:substrate-binding domain-containing protein [Paracoccaceae bacterium]
MKYLAAAFVAALCFTGFLNPAIAQDVTLTSRDKSIEVSGNLLGFDGTFYRVDTVYGELTIDGTGVLCEGPACPSLEAYIAELTFSGTPAIGRVLLPALIEGYARASGLGTQRIEVDDQLTTYELLSESGSEVVGIFTIRQTSNDEGFADILSNEADVAMALRPASSEEIAFALEAGYGNLTAATQHDVVAMEALVPTVDLNSEVSSLSIEQVAGLLNGDLKEWRTLGEDSSAYIHVVLSEPATDVLQPVSKVLSGYGYIGPFAPNVQVLESSALSVDFTFSSSIAKERRVIAISDVCGISYASGPQALKSMEYPLALPMYLYRPMRRMPKIGRDFFDFLDGQTAKRVVERAGFQAIDASETPIEIQGRRLVNAISLASPENLDVLQGAVAELKGRRLLSLVFRFSDQGYDATSS